MGKLCKIIVKDKSLKMSEAACIKKVLDYDAAHPGNACDSVSNNKSRLTEKADCYKEVIKQQTLAWGCEIQYHSYLNTLISLGGSGWGGSCRVGNLDRDGGFLPTLAISANSATLAGKLLPSGGPTVETNSKVIRSGILKQDITPTTTGAWVSESTNTFGVGNFGVADVSWLILNLGYSVSKGYSFFLENNWAITPKIGFSIESILPINKSDNQQTLRDDARRLSFFFSLELGKSHRSTVSQNDASRKDTILELVHYGVASATPWLSAGMVYKAMDRDRAVAQENFKQFTDENASSEATALSETKPLLQAAFSSGVIGAADLRQSLMLMTESRRKNVLYLDLIEVILASIATMSADKPEVIAPATLAKSRTLIDHLALHNSRTPSEALAYPMLIGGAMMGLGAFLHNSAYGGALTQAGMEGIATSVWNPNPLQSANWLDEQMYGLGITKFGRSQSNGDQDGTRMALRKRTTLKQSPVYVEATIEHPIENIALPSTIFTSIGLRATHDLTSHLRIHGNIGGGTALEWADKGLAPGAGLEIGARLSCHANAWSIGIEGQCSAIKFLDGSSKECGAGLTFGLTQ